jgi:hypothetical protein
MLIDLPVGTAVIDQVAMWTGRVVATIKHRHVVCVTLGVPENDDLAGYRVFPRERVWLSRGVGVVVSQDEPFQSSDVERVIRSWYFPQHPSVQRSYERIRERARRETEDA